MDVWDDSESVQRYVWRQRMEPDYVEEPALRSVFPPLAGATVGFGRRERRLGGANAARGGSPSHGGRTVHGDEGTPDSGSANPMD